jgi:hypothetical protein
MSNETNAPRVSARGGFFLGIGTTAIIAALVILTFRYEGTAKATVPPPNAPVATAAGPDSQQTVPLADHVAAVSAPQDQTTPAAPPTGAAVPQVSSNPGQSVLLSGTIALDKPIANSISGVATVFVIARDKTGKGHPVLAKRLNVASFPTNFSLGPEDAMMGQTPPANVSLEARIDLDGDAMTREPGVPATKIDSVAIGSHDVTLTLKKSE